jgi:hypothetical protein
MDPQNTEYIIKTLNNQRDTLLQKLYTPKITDDIALERDLQRQIKVVESIIRALTEK